MEIKAWDDYFLDLANVDSSYRFEIVENYFSIKE